MKRWHKIALITGGAIALLSLLLRMAFPNYFESVRCVGTFPNGDVVKASGDECKNPEFESVVILSLDENGKPQVEGDAVIGP